MVQISDKVIISTFFKSKGFQYYCTVKELEFHDLLNHSSCQLFVSPYRINRPRQAFRNSISWPATWNFFLKMTDTSNNWPRWCMRLRFGRTWTTSDGKTARDFLLYVTADLWNVNKRYTAEPRLSGLFLWCQFGHRYLFVTIKIRGHIPFKITALKGVVKCEGFLPSKS